MLKHLKKAVQHPKLLPPAAPGCLAPTPPFPFSSCFEVYFPTFSLEFFPSFPCSGEEQQRGKDFEGSSILYHTRLPSSPLNKALEETKQQLVVQKNCFLKGNYKVTPPQHMHKGQTQSLRNRHHPELLLLGAKPPTTF